jgi:hypothetical protein
MELPNVMKCDVQLILVTRAAMRHNPGGLEETLFVISFSASTARRGLRAE